MCKKKNLNNLVSCSFYLINFCLKSKTRYWYKNIYEFEYYIFFTTKIIFFLFSIMCKTKHITKIIWKVWLLTLCITSSYLVSEFVRLLLEFLYNK